MELVSCPEEERVAEGCSWGSPGRHISCLFPPKAGCCPTGMSQRVQDQKHLAQCFQQMATPRML